MAAAEPLVAGSMDAASVLEIEGEAELVVVVDPGGPLVGSDLLAPLMLRLETPSGIVSSTCPLAVGC